MGMPPGPRKTMSTMRRASQEARHGIPSLSFACDRKGALTARERRSVTASLTADDGFCLSGCLKFRLPPLPTSVVSGCSVAENGFQRCEQVPAPFHWRSKQIARGADPRHDFSPGTYVRTLSMSANTKYLDGSNSHVLRLLPNNFAAQEALWCDVIEGTIVICRGIVSGKCFRHHDPEKGCDARIGRLPNHMRPRNKLQFAGLLREAYNVDYHLTYASHLVKLVVTPDGMISCFAASEIHGAVDLSAVRFGLGPGRPLVDNVSLHTVDVAGSRLVCLQGHLHERFFVKPKAKQLALLPDHCTPACEIAFVTTGSCPRGFHLISLDPQNAGGVGGQLHWKDSVWCHDEIHISGMLYEVASGCMSSAVVPSLEALKVSVQDFRNFSIRKCGSVENAWSYFETDGDGLLTFTEFALGCKAMGYIGNTTRLWEILDSDGSGEVGREKFYRGLAPEESETSVKPGI